jgi:DNA topoisomerase-1
MSSLSALSSAKYTLIIVESPAKCKKIEQYLGTGYKCIASFGHIRELDGLKSINIKNNFMPTFIESESKSSQIKKIRELITNAKEVLLASDDDREGEAIAWHICQTFGLNILKTKRIIFHEITESALKKAVANPIIVNINKVNSQIARQVLDLLVGYKLSPLLWKYINTPNSKSLSAGRCQTPALRLVYENQKDINASPGTRVYNTTGYFTSKNLPFVLDVQHNCSESESESIINKEESITEFLEASVNHDHIYTCGSLRDSIKQQPTPFTTSTIQQTASNDLHLSPKETMKICQKLYEEGYITYMRTDSTIYSDEFKMKASEYITKKYGFDYNIKENIKKEEDNVVVKKDGKKLKKPVKASVAVTEASKVIVVAEDQESAHEAIRPTDITFKGEELDTKEFSSKEIRMYDLIRNHTLESCMAPATYKAFSSNISAPYNKEYKYSSEKVVFLGWRIVRYAKEETEDSFTYLQTLKSGSVLPYKKITAKETIKDLKSHYTEARLVQLLEQQGIGRPSTFSSLIEKIQDREYVKKMDVKGTKIKCVDYELEGEELAEIENDREFGNEKNKLVIQPAGMLVIEFLLKHYESLFQYAYTKQMEDTLDLIAKGLKIWHELCGDCFTQIETLTSVVQADKDVVVVTSTLKEEIKIDEEHTYMIAKYGPVIKYTPLAEKGLGKGKVKKLVPAIFKPLRHDIEIDLDKLRNGEYKLEDILATEESQRLKFSQKQEENLLGLYKEQKVYFKTGKYGPYIECGEIRKSVKTEPETTITLAEAIKVLETISTASSSPATSNVVRKITEDLSIRKGQYGDYIFYKKPGMKTPKFFKLTADFDDDYKKCDVNVVKKWIKETYGV